MRFCDNAWPKKHMAAAVGCPPVLCWGKVKRRRRGCDLTAAAREWGGGVPGNKGKSPCYQGLCVIVVNRLSTVGIPQGDSKRIPQHLILQSTYGNSTCTAMHKAVQLPAKRCLSG